MIKKLQFSTSLFFCALLLLTFSRSFAQEWTWVNGSNTYGALGVYGVQGTASTLNVPGARQGSAAWTDNSGNLWMFGGVGNSSSAYGRLNDLWKWNPSTSQWTWINGANAIDQWANYGTQGVSSATNSPGAREGAVSWIDNSGYLWLFGGYGFDGSGNLNDLNDLWKYNISTNQWTWISGTNLSYQNGVYGTQGVASSTNTPGARRIASTWKDNSGYLWLFGGYGLPASGGTESNLNDLWKYDISSNTWTWIQGSNLTNQPGVYGTLGVANSSNTPGSRYGSVACKDNSGNLWMFGGYGYDGVTNLGYLNDLWKFNTSTGQWTWVKGSDQISQASVFGTQSIPSSTTTPGGRYICASWSDSNNDLYIQGGYGVSTNPAGPDQLNDTWKYNMSTNQWTFVRGSTYPVIGSYGSIGITSTSNDPGSGNTRISWKDGSGNFWLFGGSAYDVNGNFSIMNDLWKMNSCVAGAPINVATFSGQNPCTGSTATLNAVSGTNTVNWYSSPTSTTSLATGTTYITAPLSSGTLTTNSFTYYASATNTCGVSLARTPVIVTSNSIYPVVTTGVVYTVGVSIPYGYTPNSDWSPWIYNFSDPVPAGGVVVGIDLTCDVVDQGWGGTGYPADMRVDDQRVGFPSLWHSWTSDSYTTTAPFPTYVYGGSNTFKMYFAGWSGWQGFINNGYLVIRYQLKPSLPITICQNTNFLLKAYGAISYSWTGGVTDSVSFVPMTTQTYTVTGTNIYGCTNMATQQVSVIPSPTVSVAGNTTICQGASLTQTATIAGAYDTFSWSTGSSSYIISSTPTISTDFIATATNTLTGCLHALRRKVIVNSLPIVSVSATSSTLCAGRTVSLAVTQNGSSYALNFDGVSAYIETNAAITEMGKADFSIEAWIKTTGISEGIVTCQDGNGVWDPGEKALYLDGSGIPSFVGYGNNYILGNTSVNDGLWHHIAVVWDYTGGTSGIGKMYVDGIDRTGTVSYAANNNNIGTFKIGLQNYNNYTPEAPNNFTGTIDDVRIWGVARTSTLISANMGNCLIGNESGLAAYYKFEDGPGSPNSSDQGMNDYHGVLTNMNDTSAWVAGYNNCYSSFTAYSWLPGALTTHSVSVAPAATTIYTVNVTNSYSCTGTTSKTINVNPAPVITLNSGAICTGNSFSITPGGANTYTFLNGSAVVTPTATSSYSVSGTDTFGCISAGPGVSTVTVNPLPALSISGPSAVCNGSSISETVSGANTYSWSTGSTNNTISINPTVNTTYIVSGTNTATGCFNSASKMISVGSIPFISVNSGNVCAGRVFTMTPSGAATYTFSNGTSTVLSTVSPTSNTSYYVSGTSALGCVSSNTAISNVIINPAPVIVVNSGAVCAGRVFTMTPTGASTYTFSNGSSTVVPASNSTYSVTGTNVIGCVSTVPAIASVTVNSLPTITAVNGTVCTGSSFSLVANGASTYTYVSPSGPSSSLVSPLVNTSYSVTGTSSAGCISSNTAVLTVSAIALPTITVNSGNVCTGSIFTMVPSGAATYTYSSGSSTVIPLSNTSYSVSGTSLAGCVSANQAVASVTLIATPYVSVNSGVICSGSIFTMVPSGASTYSFSGNSATVNPTSNHSYSVTGTSSLGCVSSNVAISNVVVNPLPSLAVIGTSVICNGGSTSLFATGANSYTWNTNVTGSPQNFSPVSNTVYTVTGTNSNGCANSATMLIVVNPLPTLSLNSGTVCPSSTFTIIPSGAVTYTYSSGSNIVAPVVTTTYSVTGTDGNGCVSLIPAVTTITVLNTISLSVSGTTLVCEGYSAPLFVSGASTYTWNTGALTNSIAPTPTVNSTYSVVGATGTCADTAFVSVMVNPLPNILTSSTSSLICSGESVTLTSTGANSYTWSSGENVTTIVINPTITTSYTITGEDANGCVNKTVITQSVSDCLGIRTSMANFSSLISIYPNPNNGEFVIETGKQLSVRILNSLGQEIAERLLPEGKNKIILDEQAKGIYFVEFRDGKQTKSIKLIKQ
jgi:N-acetylneuraminic acid mutarotase